MNTVLEPKCANSKKCPKRESCARHQATPNEHQVYASYFVAGAEQCSGYRPVEQDNAA